MMLSLSEKGREGKGAGGGGGGMHFPSSLSLFKSHAAMVCLRHAPKAVLTQCQASHEWKALDDFLEIISCNLSITEAIPVCCMSDWPFDMYHPLSHVSGAF